MLRIFLFSKTVLNDLVALHARRRELADKSSLRGPHDDGYDVIIIAKKINIASKPEGCKSFATKRE
jgi:hypothetical protein